jgi:DNA-binding transcriptional regulator YiaG
MVRRLTAMRDPETAALAAKIRACRIRSKLSQGAFAALVGVTQQTLSDWEHGRRLRQFVIALRLNRLLRKKTFKV